MRYNRNLKFGTTDIPLKALDFRTLSAQGRVGDLRALIDSLPPEITVWPFVFGWNAIVQLFEGELQAARENLLKLEPGWSDPDQWQELIKNSKEFACNYAGMLMGTGDEALGKDLLQQIIYYHEEILPGLIEDSHRRYELAWCYLLERSYEKEPSSVNCCVRWTRDYRQH